MKQKLTRALIDEIRKEMPVLTEMEMRCCNGGDGGTTSWDCLFNCMHHMDPSRSAQDYANDYKDIYGLDPTAMGGVPNELIGNVLSVMGFGNTVPGSMTSNRDYYQVATMVNPDGTGHTIIVFAVPDENGKISYFDPTLEGEDGKKVRKVDISDISTIYRIKKPTLILPLVLMRKATAMPMVILVMVITKIVMAMVIVITGIIIMKILVTTMVLLTVITVTIINTTINKKLCEFCKI